MTRTGDGDDGGSQLQIWESAARRQSVGVLSMNEEEWEVLVVVEAAAPDLFRGRLAYRRADEHLLTAPVIVEDSEEAVVQRAREMPASMIRQFFVSVRT